MSVKTVGVDIVHHTPIVLLNNEDGPGLLPITVGEAEAQAIMVAVNETMLPRPITHDLVKNILGELGLELRRVVINSIQEGIFYAQLELGQQEEDSFTVDSRPSDAIAIALRTESPIYSTEEVASQALIEEAAEGKSTDRERERFREFLDNLRLEDFGDLDEL